MKEKHIMGISAQKKRIEVMLCFFCARTCSNGALEECTYFADEYSGHTCPGFIRSQDDKERLMKLLEEDAYPEADPSTAQMIPSAFSGQKHILGEKGKSAGG